MQGAVAEILLICAGHRWPGPLPGPFGLKMRALAYPHIQDQEANGGLDDELGDERRRDGPKDRSHCPRAVPDFPSTEKCRCQRRRPIFYADGVGSSWCVA